MSAPRLRVNRSLVLSLVLAALFAWLASAQPAAACSCAYSPDPGLAFSRASAVFVGTPTTIGDRATWLDHLRRWLGMPWSSAMFLRQVRLDVTDSWKGVTTSPATVVTGYGGAVCGFDFVVGRPYLVFAQQSDMGLATSICTRTAELSQAGADLAYLAGQPKLAVTPAAASPGWLLACLGAGLALVAALAVGMSLFAWRRARAAR